MIDRKKGKAGAGRKKKREGQSDGGRPRAVVARKDGRVFRNTSIDCQKDAVQVLLNNQLGDDTIATMTVTNDGVCPVSVGTGKKRGDFSDGGGETYVPGGTQEFVRVKVPAGMFLLASCIGENECGCDWVITDLSV